MGKVNSAKMGLTRIFLSVYQRILVPIYQKMIIFLTFTFNLFRNRIKLKKKEKTSLDVLNLPEDAKYLQIKASYRKLMFKYKPNLKIDYTKETREVMEAYNKLKLDENIYLDTFWFKDETIAENLAECLSNLENKTIAVTEENIKSTLGKYRKKYLKLVPFVRKKIIDRMLKQDKTRIKPEKDTSKVQKPKQKKENKEKKEFSCDICGKEYKQQTKYEEHLQSRKHASKCKELGLAIKIVKKEPSKTVKKEKTHIETLIKPEKQSPEKKKVVKLTEPKHFLTCSYCGNSFRTRGELILHLQQH